MFYSVLGDITPRPVSIPEVLPGLTSNAITLVNVPPLVAEQLQWASRLDHLNTLATHFEIGALVVKARGSRRCRRMRRARCSTRGASRPKR